MNNFLKVILLLNITYHFFSCDTEKCSEYGPSDTPFVLELLDKNNGKYLMGDWGSKYDYEIVELLDEEGNLPKNLEVGPGCNIVFTIAESDTEALEQDITKKFYLYLPDEMGIPKRDVDTLVFKYRFKKKENCPEDTWFKSFSASYNDSLYHEGEYVEIIQFLK